MRFHKLPLKRTRRGNLHLAESVRLEDWDQKPLPWKTTCRQLARPSTGPDAPGSASATVTCCDWLVSFSSHKSCSNAAGRFGETQGPERVGVNLRIVVNLWLALSKWNLTPRRCPIIFAMPATDECDVAWWWGQVRCLAHPDSPQSVCCPQLALFVTMDGNIPTATSRCHCCAA